MELTVIRAIENLDRQTRLVEEESHAQLVELWEELNSRRRIQIERLEARHE